VTIPGPDNGQTTVLLNARPGTKLSAGGIETAGEVAVLRAAADGKAQARFVYAK
jgi:hypothetical protein